MLHLWHVAVVLLLACCPIQADTLSIISNNNSNTNTAFSLLAMQRVLRRATRDLFTVNILLRANEWESDAQNSYVIWFQNRCRCTTRLSSYTPMPYAPLPMPQQRENYAIVGSLEQLRATAQHYVQRSGSFFYIFSENVATRRSGKLTRILDELWQQRKSYQQHVLMPAGVYVYDPMQADGRLIRYEGTQDLNYMLFHDMRGYPLKVSTFYSTFSRPVLDHKTGKIIQVDGPDGRVLELLQKRLNFTIDFQKPNPSQHGERTANGSFNGVLGQLIRDEIDICLTGFFVKDYRMSKMDFSVTVYNDRLCIYMAKAKRVPESILLLYLVRKTIGIFIIIGFMFGTLWCMVRYMNLRLHPNKLTNRRPLWLQFLYILSDTWVVWVRSTIARYPPFRTERLLVATLCLLSVIFGVILESQLATVYIKPVYYSDIQTLQEFDESGFLIYYKFSSFADDLFFSETSTLYDSLNNKLRLVNNYDGDLLKAVLNEPNIAGVSRFYSLYSGNMDDIVTNRIWIVPECPKYYSISYVLPQDSPFEYIINHELLEFLSYGFIQYYLQEFRMNVEVRTIADLNKRNLERIELNKSIKVKDIQLPLIILALGNFLAFLVLLGECTLKRRQKQKALKMHQEAFIFQR